MSQLFSSTHLPSWKGAADKLPDTPIVLFKDRDFKFEGISGPSPFQQSLFVNHSAKVGTGSSINTNPHLPSQRYASGAPIADRFQVVVFGNRTLIVLTDGSGWGAKAAHAAETARNLFMSALLENQEKFRTAREAALILKAAAMQVHKQLSGARLQAALLGGILLPVSEARGDSNSKFLFVGVNVGGGKAFLISPNEVMDITSGSLTGVNLGEEDEIGLGTELVGRNVKFYSSQVRHGDLIMFATPSVYLNFHPMYWGKHPTDLNIQAESWEEIGLEPEALKDAAAVSDFTKAKLKECLGQILRRPSAGDVCQRLLDYIYDFTTARRQRLEIPGESVLSYSTSPGKLGHSTCVLVNCGLSSNNISHRVLGNDREHLWEWTMFIPATEPAANQKKAYRSKSKFDVFKHLKAQNPTFKRGCRHLDEFSLAGYHLFLGNPSFDFRINWEVSSVQAETPRRRNRTRTVSANKENSKPTVRTRSLSHTESEPVSDSLVQPFKGTLRVLESEADNISTWKDCGSVQLSKETTRSHIVGKLKDAMFSLKQTKRMHNKLRQVSAINSESLVEISGTTQSFSFQQLGSIFHVLSGGLKVSQSDILIHSFKGERLWAGRMITAESSSREYLSRFTAQFIPGTDCSIKKSFPDFMSSLLSPDVVTPHSPVVSKRTSFVLGEARKPRRENSEIKLQTLLKPLPAIPVHDRKALPPLPTTP